MSNRKIRNKLWNQNPQCFWCFCNTRKPPDDPGAPIYPDTATLDHVVSSWHKRLNPDAEQMLVIACSECNAERGRAHQLIFLAFHRQATARACNPRLVRLGEIFKQALTVRTLVKRPTEQTTLS
jgi:hypothetical protein